MYTTKEVCSNPGIDNEEEIKILKNGTKRRYKNLVERAKIYNSPTLSFSELWEIVLESYKNDFRCFYCNRKMRVKGDKNDSSDAFSIDHYIPLSEGGESSQDNIVICCARCNLVKGTMNGDTFKGLLSQFDDSYLREKYLNEMYRASLSRKLERLESEGLLRKYRKTSIYQTKLWR